MSKNIILTGSTGKTYDLDDLNSSSRINSDQALLVQVWEWSPLLPKDNPHSSPNPPDPVIGQIWLSKCLDATNDSERIEALRNISED